jgi:hypothetical protein
MNRGRCLMALPLLVGGAVIGRAQDAAPPRPTYPLIMLQLPVAIDDSAHWSVRTVDTPAGVIDELYATGSHGESLAVAVKRVDETVTCEEMIAASREQGVRVAGAPRWLAEGWHRRTVLSPVGLYICLPVERGFVLVHVVTPRTREAEDAVRRALAGVRAASEARWGMPRHR